MQHVLVKKLSLFCQKEIMCICYATHVLFLHCHIEFLKNPGAKHTINFKWPYEFLSLFKKNIHFMTKIKNSK